MYGGAMIHDWMNGIPKNEAAGLIKPVVKPQNVDFFKRRVE